MEKENIPNPPAIENMVKKDHFAEQFSKMGTELIKNIDKPNVITLAQFEPFISLFQDNQKKYEEDDSYAKERNALFLRYKNELSINLYQPTIVIESLENPVEHYFLDRIFTRIKSDQVMGASFREQVPSNIPKNASVTQADLVINASVKDIAAANNTPEQIEYFKRVRASSALITKLFVDRNLNPELMDKFTASGNDSLVSPDDSLSSTDFFDEE